MTTVIDMDEVELLSLAEAARRVGGVADETFLRLYPQALMYREESGRYYIPLHRLKAWQTAREHSPNEGPGQGEGSERLGSGSLLSPTSPRGEQRSA